MRSLLGTKADWGGGASAETFVHGWGFDRGWSETSSVSRSVWVVIQTYNREEEGGGGDGRR